MFSLEGRVPRVPLLELLTRVGLVELVPPRCLLEENGRQKSAPRLVVQSQAHQGHRLGDPQALTQAPTKHLAVARGQQKSRTRYLRRSGDQSLQIVIGIGHGMTKKANYGGIRGNGAVALDDCGRALIDSAQQFVCPVVPVNSAAQAVAGVEICLRGGADRETSDCALKGSALESCERLTDIKT